MEREVKQKLEQLGKNILWNARNELYLAMRFLDVALGRFQYEMNMQTFFMGCDGEKLYFNPRFVAERFACNKVLVNRGYLHMVFHCIFLHIQPEKDVEEDLWNLACDIVVESIIDGFDYKETNQLVSDYRQEWYERLEGHLKVLTAEGVYRVLLKENVQPSELVRLEAAFLVDDHQFWNYEKKKDEENQQENYPSRNNASVMEFWKEVSEKTKTNLETFSKQAGDELRNLVKALKVQTRERYDYREFLRKFSVLSEENKIDEDSFEYGFYMYGLSLYENMPLIEPLEYKESQKIKDFVIAIDTSGSCSGELVQHFLEETVKILLESGSFFEKSHIHIIQCDNQIQEDIVIGSMDDLERYKEEFRVRGYGGTDFRPVFAHVNDLVAHGEFENLKGLIYFTDGVGVFPKKRPPYDVCFVFMKDDYTDAKVPPWAMKLMIDTNEYERD